MGLGLAALHGRVLVVADRDDRLVAIGEVGQLVGAQRLLAGGARLHLLHTVQAATALAQLCVGDEVRINHTVKPRYLHGARGRVIDLDDHTATVCLHRPIGRFTSGQIRCSALALDRLNPAPTTKAA